MLFHRFWFRALLLPGSDLSILVEAAEKAGEIATRYWQKSPKTWEKDAGAGPVTEADLDVNDMLKDFLTTARPDYGWLSEETLDTTARQSRELVFIIDPIDGTRSFIAGEKTWAHSLAIAQQGRITAAVIYLPLRDKLYSARLGNGAHLNGIKIQQSGRTELVDARVLSAKSNFDASHWPGGVPNIQRHFRSSLAYRLALVAEGRFDAMITLRDTWEWDVAAGSLIVQEAGATVTNRFGEAAVFNNPRPALSGLLAANQDVHHALAKSLDQKGSLPATGSIRL